MAACTSSCEGSGTFSILSLSFADFFVVSSFSELAPVGVSEDFFWRRDFAEVVFALVDGEASEPLDDDCCGCVPVFDAGSVADDGAGEVEGSGYLGVGAGEGFPSGVRSGLPPVTSAPGGSIL